MIYALVILIIGLLAERKLLKLQIRHEKHLCELTARREQLIYKLVALQQGADIEGMDEICNKMRSDTETDAKLQMILDKMPDND